MNGGKIHVKDQGIEGIPVIIRFKTQQIRVLNKYYY